MYHCSAFIPESCVSDNPIRYERPRMTTNTTTVPLGMIPIPATVELRFRPRPQSNTIHPDEFKWFKLVVALLWRFPNHQDSSRITTTRIGADVSMVLLRLMPTHHDLINRGES